MSDIHAVAKKEVWDAFYRSPEDQVVMRSRDGILFRASAYRLASASTVFADMISLGAAANTSPIDIDADSRIVTRFLNLLHAAPDITVRIPPYGRLDLLDLGRRFDCPLVTKWALEDLGSIFHIHDRSYWDTLYSLSVKQDIEAGLILIKMIHSYSCQTASLKCFWTGVDRLENGWREAVIDALIGLSSPDVMRYLHFPMTVPEDRWCTIFYVPEWVEKFPELVHSHSGRPAQPLTSDRKRSASGGKSLQRSCKKSRI